MIVNGKSLLEAHPIKDMLDTKVKGRETTHGLGEAGYDIRLAEEIVFNPKSGYDSVTVNGAVFKGRFVLASAMEDFQMPTNLVGIVHDKSTNARRGLSVFNTVIEPGWFGKLTLELVFHGQEQLILPRGMGIAQVIFHEIFCQASYTGKYQFQEAGPQKARST